MSMECLILAGLVLCILIAMCACGANRQATAHRRVYGTPMAPDPAFDPEIADGGAVAQGLPLPGWPMNPVHVNTLPPAEQANNLIGAIGGSVMNESVAAAQPLPPRFEPLPELGPQRMWQPTWQGCAPTAVNKSCIFHQPNPRLWYRDLNELVFQRSLGMGQDHLFEPVKARQSWMQLLAADFRSKKDPFTRATPQNSLSYSTCEQMAKQTPEYTNF